MNHFVPFLLLVILALVAAEDSVSPFHPDGQIRCGDGKGKSCSNAFNNIYCDSQDGACCKDDFNGWCCPEGFACAGSYKDPGGNNHCMTAAHVSSSCICQERGYTIVKVTEVGPMKIDSAYDTHLVACCETPHTDKCGWDATITMSNTQTVTWSDTSSVGLTVGFEAGVPGDLVKAGFEVKNSYTTGQTTTNTATQSYTSGCTCTSNCFTPWAKLTFKLSYQTSHQPVQFTVRNCGANKVIDGTITVQQFQAKSICDPGTHGYPDESSCDAGMAELQAAYNKTLDTNYTKGW